MSAAGTAGERAHPAEHLRRPEGCTAERCWCVYLKFHAARASAKLRKGGAGD